MSRQFESSGLAAVERCCEARDVENSREGLVLGLVTVAEFMKMFMLEVEGGEDDGLVGV